NTAALVVNSPDEAVTWSEEKAGGLDVTRMGTEQQPILGKSGDRVRIDWGYLYVAAPQGQSVHEAVGDERAVIGPFLSNGSLPAQADSRMPRPAGDHPPSIAVVFEVGPVGPEPIQRHLILAYDEIYPVEYFHVRLKPYWRRNNAQAEDLLESAEKDYGRLRKECAAFDKKLMADLKQVGGERYAEVAALAYRQSLAANKLATGPDGKPLLFLKEISSCGCAQTVDVFYPEAPLLLLVNPKLLEYTLTPILDYATSGKWPYPYSPHDLGTYPLDNARVPSEMESMPVEESGNMLLLVAAIAKAEGNVEFASEHWPVLSKWAGYLKANGLDPANQLCTDDFTGHLAHNTNLSLKAIEAMGAYAMLAGMLGKKDVAADYRKIAEADAVQWMKMADDGDHYRLAFDRPGTWSQKYNLIWDRVLGLNLFPPEVAQKELAFYRKQETAFGFPLDSRAAYTKLDWESWSAALSGSDQEFQSFFARLSNFANETPTRVPLSDWYWTPDGTQTGFQARPVVGAVFIRMLTDPSMWRRWATN
ncbi:MAG: glutaminase domain-containing protein, partial [Terriglobia bacterium]